MHGNQIIILLHPLSLLQTVLALTPSKTTTNRSEYEQPSQSVHVYSSKVLHLEFN
jgi:hypothetical protein